MTFAENSLTFSSLQIGWKSTVDLEINYQNPKNGIYKIANYCEHKVIYMINLILMHFYIIGTFIEHGYFARVGQGKRLFQ